MRISTDFLYQQGMKYWLGRGVEADAVAAHKWFNLAAQFGNAKAVKLREGLLEEMSSEQIRAAQQQAREWLASRSSVQA